MFAQRSSANRTPNFTCERRIFQMVQSVLLVLYLFKKGGAQSVKEPQKKKTVDAIIIFFVDNSFVQVGSSSNAPKSSHLNLYCRAA